MKKVYRCILLACTMLTIQNVHADEAIPASECRIETEGDSAHCNVKNTVAYRSIVCSIETIGTTQKGEVFKSRQIRTILPDRYVVQHIKNFGDYVRDPIVKVEGFTQCQ